MINEEKVILMTRASIYESRSGKDKLRISEYFRHDYISLQILFGWFFGTVSFALCAVLWGVCNMEYLLNNLHKMDLKSFGSKVVLFYVLTVGVYICILYGVCAYRYHVAKKSVNAYGRTLQKLSGIYAKEEKSASSGALMEEKRHGRIT